MSKITIILDAHGGDHAPLEPIKGAAAAVAEYGVSVVLCGKENELREVMKKNGISDIGMRFAPAASVIPVEANPTELLKTYKDSSMCIGLEMLAAGDGDAFVTAGSTGAFVVGSTLVVKRIKGVKRPALATIIPCQGGRYFLLDAGANTECRPETLCQFAVMGSAYASKILGVENPRVGLVNIGSEETKGLDLHRETYAMLKETKLNFIGNVEARGLPLGECDVAVCDGFVGNVVLKLTEGMGKMMSGEIKNILMANTSTKIAALMLKGGFAGFKKRMDYTEYGGAPLMGISKPVIKAHGSSNAKAFKNAMRQAKEVCERGVVEQISQEISDSDKE